MAERLRTDDPVQAAVARAVELLDGIARPRIAISGGSALSLVNPLREALGDRWRDARITFADERCVAFEHEDSNRGQAFRQGALDENTNVLPLYEDGESPEEACRRFSSAFERDFGGLDLAILGMGGDGHTASLFVGRDWSESPCHAVFDSPKPPPDRITLSLPVLAASPCLIFAVGEAKQPIIERVLAGDEALPASHLPSLIIVTDG